MRIRIAAMLALGLVVTACASVEAVSKLEPSFFGSTPRTAQDYSDCVMAAWEGQGNTVQRRPIQDGFQVSASSSISVEGVLTVITYRGKTDVKMSTRLQARAQPLIEAANLCM
ncbi:hypothetical protein [Bordetella genomosp. 13]|uniref:Lipoprotein n=1 Tax=Bordetella genomosp. 13 TaxID=463040 RepID=A0A1W6ZDW4_9BORD|nr:hypothetical protein [Bordetella genomosp. 13]ARP95340.1 hypothetical protein CAL15_13670 [Bordetella genomosp. 13]